jgi:hypothetical protein
MDLGALLEEPAAESTFRKLKGAELLPAVYAGAQYMNEALQATSTQKIAA